MILLNLLKNKVNWERVTASAAAALIIVLVIYAWLQHIALEQTRAIYQNPRKAEYVRIVRVAGPVRIVTRTIKTPDREETTREEVHEPVVEVRETSRISEPVLSPQSRSARWLVGAAIQPFQHDAGNWTAYLGHPIGQHIDLCAGFSNTRRTSVMLMLRF